MENKYFTPGEEDIRIGYELEVQTMRDWVSGKFPEVLKSNKELDEFKEDDLMKLAHAIIRVPYLTKEQIESEGWKESDVLEFFDRIGNDRWYLSWEPKFNWLTIGDNENENGFSGECKDINTLRFLQKLLKIK